MAHSVRETTASEQPTAVVVAGTSWDAFGSLWPQLLDEVWAVARASDAIVPGRNVMLYKDDVPNVEVGVEVSEPFAAVGRVVSSTLPAGRVATTLHRGSYDELGSAHEAVIVWCNEHGLRRTGVRWEIYGHWVENSADQEVEIYYLLR
jgi:effector-binding domain-containing protein